MMKLTIPALLISIISLFFVFGIMACSIAEPNTGFIISQTINETHADTHAFNGSDEISVLDLSGLLADSQTPLTHNSTHAINSTDTINVTGLLGLLADGQTPLAHATSHELGGSDSINVTGLPGAGGGGGGMDDLIDDTTPQLGGDLDLNDFEIQDDIITLQATNANAYYFDNTGGGGDTGFHFTHNDPTPQNNSYLNFTYRLMDSGSNLQQIGRYVVYMSDWTNGSEDAEFWWYLWNGGASNQVMKLDGAGNLDVDVGYGTFDEFDDAELLRAAISGNNTQLLVDAGVFSDKITANGTQSGYTMNVQKMNRLLAGGVYQNRDYIELLESYIQALEARIKILEDLR